MALFSSPHITYRRIPPTTAEALFLSISPLVLVMMLGLALLRNRDRVRRTHSRVRGVRCRIVGRRLACTLPFAKESSF